MKSETWNENARWGLYANIQAFNVGPSASLTRCFVEKTSLHGARGNGGGSFVVKRENASNKNSEIKKAHSRTTRVISARLKFQNS